MMKEYDVAIIGAGPTGLFAGFYAGMRSLNAVIIDKLEIPGGQLAALYPEKNIYDIAGFSEIKAQDLVDNLVNQVSRFEKSTHYSLGNSVEEIEKNGDDFIIKGTAEDFKVKSIIIAGGNGAFAPRKIGLENEDLFNNISYFVNDVSKYDNKNVVIFGGGDSALDWALTLEKNAKSVTIVHRRNDFRAHDHSVELLEKSSVIKYTPFNCKQLIGDGRVSKIVIEEVKGNEIIEIDVDEIIVTYGFISNLGPIENWGLEIEKRKIKVDSEQKTNIDGIFAIGDICTYSGKAALIISGMGEGPIAINGCYKKINPNAIVGALHSTSVIGGKNE